jgi:ubiquitin carboxyl-terminal hydrolase 36/42
MENYNAIKGNPNLGNTCFFNSVLQLLAQCTVLNKLLIDNNIEGTLIDIYKRYINSYIDFNTNSSSESNKQAKPQEIVIYVSRLLGRRSWSQEDSDQYVGFIIDCIIDEFKEWAKKNPDLIVANKSMTLDDLIMNLFTIKCNKQIFCSECAYISKTNDDIHKLYLSINDVQSNTNLNELLSIYVDETLDSNNKWKCEKCSNLICANIKRNIYKWPKYFIITLKRYANNNHKINTEIDMPLSFSFDNKNFVLRGFIYHMGSTSGGHYVYYGCKNGKWFLFNDSSVSEIDQNTLNNVVKIGYVYLYVCK